MKDKVRFAIIGSGHIGKRHAEKIAANPSAVLVAVCDSKKDRVNALAKEYDVQAFEDYKDLLALDNVDVVNICTPNGLHAEMCINAANAKKHVLCEKPMALSSSDAQDMIAAAEKNNVKLLVVKQNRYNPPVVAVKEALEAGKLGDLSMVMVNCIWNRNPDYYDQADWRGTKDLDGGALFTQFSHFVDLMLYLAGSVKSVFANADNLNHPNIDIDDVGSVMLRFKNGAVGSLTYTTNAYPKNFEGSITLIGSKGMVKIGGQYLNELEFWSVDGEPEKKVEKGAAPNNYGFYQGSMSNHDKVIANVVDVFLNDATIKTTGMEGYKTVEIIEAMYASAEDHKEVLL